jgi:hypothetical protein
MLDVTEVVSLRPPVYKHHAVSTRSNTWHWGQEIAYRAQEGVNITVTSIVLEIWLC